MPVVALGAFASAIGSVGSVIVASAINGAIIGAAIGGISAAINGGNILEGIGKGALTGAVTGAVGGALGAAFKGADVMIAQQNAAIASGQAGSVKLGAGSSAEYGETQLAAGNEAFAGGGVTTGAPADGSQAGPVDPNGVTPVPGATSDLQAMMQNQQVMNNQNLAMQKTMADKAFYRETASGFITEGLGAYAEGKEAEEMREAQKELAEEMRGAGVGRFEHGGASVDPNYAADQARVIAPTAPIPKAIKVGVGTPTAGIKNVSTEQGVLP